MAKGDLTFGVKSCAECSNNIRCEECVYNKASIDFLIKRTAGEILNTLNRTPNEYHERKIKELAKQYGVEIEE